MTHFNWLKYQSSFVCKKWIVGGRKCLFGFVTRVGAWRVVDGSIVLQLPSSSLVYFTTNTFAAPDKNFVTFSSVQDNIAGLERSWRDSFTVVLNWTEKRMHEVCKKNWIHVWFFPQNGLFVCLIWNWNLFISEPMCVKLILLPLNWKFPPHPSTENLGSKLFVSKSDRWCGKSCTS